MVLVSIKHFRTADGLCSRGARLWMKRYGFSWDEFLDPGIDADLLEATGDLFAIRVCEIARKEAEANG